jgi:hypothetical protein
MLMAIPRQDSCACKSLIDPCFFTSSVLQVGESRKTTIRESELGNCWCNNARRSAESASGRVVELSRQRNHSVAETSAFKSRFEEVLTRSLGCCPLLRATRDCERQCFSKFWVHLQDQVFVAEWCLTKQALACSVFVAQVRVDLKPGPHLE